MIPWMKRVAMFGASGQRKAPGNEVLRGREIVQGLIVNDHGG